MVVLDDALRAAFAGKRGKHWSPAQISRWLRRRWPRRHHWHVCYETIYEAVYRGLIVPTGQQTLRTGRTHRHKRGRDRTRDGALRQSTNMKSIHDRPAIVETRSSQATATSSVWRYSTQFYDPPHHGDARMPLVADLVHEYLDIDRTLVRAHQVLDDVHHCH